MLKRSRLPRRYYLYRTSLWPSASAEVRSKWLQVRLSLVICLFLNNTFLASGPTKLSVPGFSLDDTITSDDVQEDPGSDPNRRSWFTIFIYCTFQVILWAALVVKKVAPLIASKKVCNIKLTRRKFWRQAFLDCKQHQQMESSPRRACPWYGFSLSCFGDLFFWLICDDWGSLFSSLYPILADHPSEGFWYFDFDPRICKRNIATSRNWIPVFRHQWPNLFALCPSVQDTWSTETS